MEMRMFAPIICTLREIRLRWYGDVLRAQDNGNGSLISVAHTLQVSGKRPVGRPKRRWYDVITMDFKDAGISSELAYNRIR